MFESGKILVVLDADEEQQPALVRARQLAERTGSAVELLIADYSSYLEDGFYFDPIQAQELRREHGEKQLQDAEVLAEPLRESGIDVSVTVAWGNPPISEIIKRIQESKPALVVKAVTHHARLTNLILGNDDWEAIRFSEAPLLLVKSGKWQEKPNFIAAVDPAHVHDKPASLDNKIIAAANTLANAFDGGVYAFHSAWMPPLSGMYPVIPNARVEEEALAQFAASHDIEAGQCLWSDDAITESLPKLCDALNASAVVMGAVSRSRLDRILIGSTAEKLIDKLDCDILVVKPDEMPQVSSILI